MKSTKRKVKFLIFSISLIVGILGIMTSFIIGLPPQDLDSAPKHVKDSYYYNSQVIQPIIFYLSLLVLLAPFTTTIIIIFKKAYKFLILKF